MKNCYKDRKWEKYTYRTNHFPYVIMLFELILLISVFNMSSVFAEENAINETIPEVSSYELHYMLDAEKILDENNSIRPEYVSKFELIEDNKSYGLYYMDTMKQDFFKEGWINRVRMRVDKPSGKYEVTCKKRYTVKNGDVASALRQAESDGVFKSDSKWSAEVELTYFGMTLSLSSEKEYPVDENESFEDLTTENAKSMVKDAMPVSEREWKAQDWGMQMLDASSCGGPVYFRRYSGKYLGEEVRLEVWFLKDKLLLCELSLKTDSLSKAQQLKENLTQELNKAGILIQEDSLKTKKIIDYYFKEKSPTVSFNTNGCGTAPDAQTVEYNGTAHSKAG